MKKTVCLNMIVKNEAPVIKRCLATVKPWIDTWVISDTGSTDGTQDIILEFMRDIPGQLIEKKWVDFAHNRNEVLEIARSRSDYSFFIDADEQFIPNVGVTELPTDCDYYSIQINEGISFHERIFFINNSCPIFWKGVLHEGLYADRTCKGRLWEGGEILSKSEEGNRSRDPKKYLKDAKVLEDALVIDPQNYRYQFFLAQSYANAHRYDLALQAYTKRSEMGGNPDEVFFSLFMIGVSQEVLGFDPKIYAQSLLKAHQFRPYRHEPLYGLAIFYMRQGQFQKAYDVLKRALEIRCPDDSIFVQTHIRDHLIPCSFVQCCEKLGKYEECLKIGTELLSKKDIPKQMYQELRQNLIQIRSTISSMDIIL
jgi:tetratricopeptide (TPR) repeat protein